MKNINYRLIICVAGLLLNSACAMSAANVSQCELISEFNSQHQAIPLCLKPPISSDSAEVLFRFIFDTDFPGDGLEKYLDLLEIFKPYLVNGEYLYIKADIYRAFNEDIEALKLYKQAASEGSARAAYEAFSQLKYLDKKVAKRYLEQAAIGGYPIAQYTLGVFKFYGQEGYDVDQKEGIKWLQESARKADPLAQSKLVELQEYLDDEERIFWQLVYAMTGGEVSDKEYKELIEKVNGEKWLCERMISSSPGLLIDLQPSTELSELEFTALRNMIITCMH